MSEPTLRPIWTPDDARQTAIDAPQHVGIPGTPDEPEGMLPFRRPAGSTCAACGARPDDQCWPWCLNLMTDDEQRAHRDAVIDSVIAELALEESAPVVVDCPVVTPRPTGAHRRQTSRASHFAKMTLAVVVLVLVLVVGVLWAAARANAIATNCQQQPWLYGGLFGRMTTRTICDGPIRTDGSWLRNRNFYAPAYDVPVSCSWTRAGGGCSGGYRKPVFDTGIETYVVTPETVLADEPGHIAPRSVVDVGWLALGRDRSRRRRADRELHRATGGGLRRKLRDRSARAVGSNVGMTIHAKLAGDRSNAAFKSQNRRLREQVK